MTTPFERHRAAGHAESRHSPDGVNTIVECEVCRLAWQLPLRHQAGAWPVTLWNWEYAKSAQKKPRYDTARIADELEATAQGEAHYGNALRVAKDHPALDVCHRFILDRFATGLDTDADRFELQNIANLIRRYPAP